jgi:hypothetical protein
MLNMKNKDLIMLGIIIGIAFFFIGAIISNVFPSDETNLLSYKISASIKLIGMGFLISSMVVGGIIVEDIDKNLKMLLLILGLILLIIYTIGAQQLNWNVSGMLGSPSSSEAYNSRPTGYGIPGFEAVCAIAAIAAVLLISRIKRRR